MKRFWNWLDGKKTVVAEFYWSTGAAVILVWFPDGLPQPWNKVNLSIGLALTGLGLGHKAFKKAVADKGE